MTAGELLRAAREDLARGFTVRAGTRLRQASAAGNPEALTELARGLLEGRIPGPPAEARQWLERAGDALAEIDLLLLRAGLRYRGLGGPLAPTDALADLARAAAAGSAEACVEMALLWQEHPGAAARSEAGNWLAAAADNGLDTGEFEALLGANGGRTSATRVPALALAAPDRRSELLNTDPHIARFADTVRPFECAWLRCRAQPRLEPSRVFDPRTGVPRADPVRTGETMYFGRATPGVFAWRLSRRLAALAGCDAARAEPLAVLRYSPGQEYRPHHDGLDAQVLARDPLRAAGDRTATVLAWLNEPGAGGATLFPRLGLRVAPSAGAALVFFNLDAEGRPAAGALHAGEPVAAGEKWLASLWIRQRPLATAG